MRLTELLPLLVGVKARGLHYVATCPAHADTDPSLQITEGEEALLLKCWAGCELGAILRALRLETKDLWYEQRTPEAASREREIRKQAKVRDAAIDEAAGLQVDQIRQASILILAARGLDISGLSNDELDAMLEDLADAYKLLERENDGLIPFIPFQTPF